MVYIGVVLASSVQFYAAPSLILVAAALLLAVIIGKRRTPGTPPPRPSRSSNLLNTVRPAAPSVIKGEVVDAYVADIRRDAAASAVPSSMLSATNRLISEVRLARPVSFFAFTETPARLLAMNQGLLYICDADTVAMVSPSDTSIAHGNLPNGEVAWIDIEGTKYFVLKPQSRAVALVQILHSKAIRVDHLQSAATSHGPRASIANTLQELGSLHDASLISESEYLAKKAEILGRL